MRCKLIVCNVLIYCMWQIYPLPFISFPGGSFWGFGGEFAFYFWSSFLCVHPLIFIHSVREEENKPTHFYVFSQSVGVCCGERDEVALRNTKDIFLSSPFPQQNSLHCIDLNTGKKTLKTRKKKSAWLRRVNLQNLFKKSTFFNEKKTWLKKKTFEVMF